MTTAVLPSADTNGWESAAAARRRAPRWLRGRDQDQPWVRPALLTLLAATAVLYLWGLGDSGWANSFYSAAVQAGTKSWKALFFGSSDGANFITVDKPPAALWVMDISARLFGVNSWSILVPQALEGVAAVGVLYATVRRWFAPETALVAGAVLAFSPVAALMFRFNNPDSLLVLFLVASAYAATRALEAASTKWLVLAGCFIGLGFLAKSLQAVIVVPALGLAYLVAAPTGLRRRIMQMLVAGAAMIAAGGWWVAAVQLIPAADRPYIGGSQNNSLFNVIFGYNGFGRLTGNETGSVGGAGPTGSRWGLTGLTRMFSADTGTQVAWLLPAALLLLVAVLVWTRRAPRLDRTRAALILWGGWLLISCAVFSYSRGIIHPYYTVALAPAIGAVVGIGAVTLWSQRAGLLARLVLAASIDATAWWAFVLLRRTPTWHPLLRTTVLVVGIATALAVVGLARRRAWMAGVVGVSAVVSALAGPAAYSLATASTPHSGAIPSAGPPAGGRGVRLGFGGFGGIGARPPSSGARPPSSGARRRAQGGPGGRPGFAPFPGLPGFGFGRGPAFGTGGLLNGSSPSKATVTFLLNGATGYTWVAAAVGSNVASGYQLATDKPVMAIGGFNGTDPAPTLAEFERYVHEDKVHYFIGAFGPGLGRATTTGGQIASWVQTHFAMKSAGGVTVYDLSSPTGA